LPDDGDFLPLLDAAVADLVSLPAGGISAMHYEAGRLDLDIKLARVEDLNGLAQRLRGKGLNVQMNEPHDTGSGIGARLTLMPGAGQ
jgi:hypothetical protein